jgi:hypothetical protein
MRSRRRAYMALRRLVATDSSHQIPRQSGHYVVPDGRIPCELSAVSGDRRERSARVTSLGSA